MTKIFTPEELELILCGTQILDFHELKLACQYEEYDKNSETIKYFWEILFDFNEEEKKSFYLLLLDVIELLLMDLDLFLLL